MYLFIVMWRLKKYIFSNYYWVTLTKEVLWKHSNDCVRVGRNLKIYIIWIYSVIGMQFYKRTWGCGKITSTILICITKWRSSGSGNKVTVILSAPVPTRTHLVHHVRTFWLSFYVRLLKCSLKFIGLAISPMPCKNQ